ncbi:unnamed protein product [Oppiella nova]|uniref:ATP-dependent helicase C-terminal domain-containing protein n=1 Tax=Oppiella nova TaxID=334625 RepID=A0A7R9LHZ1_9ACAR|nr:unnamed protein product [Oppiella nova]CAG2163143.1 unnamed protein product [Oppiella nova]
MTSPLELQSLTISGVEVLFPYKPYDIQLDYMKSIIHCCQQQKVDENQSSGAVFFGVFRGKLSEGIDLPDDYCRGVIMTGLPFPAVMDPRVILKKEYLNKANTGLTPSVWYALQMKRALNQAIGRVVRHKDDFGVIILMDSRFATLSDGLSKWIERFIEHNDNNQSPYVNQNQ